jgi:hypothetical protein
MPEIFKMCLGVSSAFMKPYCYLVQKSKLTTEAVLQSSGATTKSYEATEAQKRFNGFMSKHKQVLICPKRFCHFSSVSLYASLKLHTASVVKTFVVGQP